MAELTAQINVRMNKEDKERGEAALASIGFTVSEAIRALMARAASGTKGLLDTKRLLEEPAPAEVDERLGAVEEGAQLFDKYWAQMEEMVGHPVERVSYDDMSDEEYIDMLRQEHYREKGLL